MIRLIVGNKGSGKTKTLINMVNEAVKSTDGKVVCVEKGLKLTYDIDRDARLIDIDEYSVQGPDALYGFLVGLYAGNYDITEIYVDKTLKITGRDYEALADMLERVVEIGEKAGFVLTVTLSCDRSELPERIHKYIIN